MVDSNVPHEVSFLLLHEDVVNTCFALPLNVCEDAFLAVLKNVYKMSRSTLPL